MFRFISAALGLSVAVTAGAWAAGGLLRVEGCAPLSAGTYQVMAMNVSYDDLDASTADGASELYRRLEAATHVVCGERLAQRTNGPLATKFSACRAQALSRAVAAAKLPALTQVAASN